MDGSTEECTAGSHVSCAGFEFMDQRMVGWCNCFCHKPEIASELNRRLVASQAYQPRTSVRSIALPAAGGVPSAPAPADDSSSA